MGRGVPDSPQVQMPCLPPSPLPSLTELPRLSSAVYRGTSGAVVEGGWKGSGKTQQPLKVCLSSLLRLGALRAHLLDCAVGSLPGALWSGVRLDLHGQ